MSTSLRIGVVGAGTMGRGIAHLFASHGNDVLVFDASMAAAQQCKDIISRHLLSLMERGKILPAEVDGILSRMSVAPSLRDLAPADLIVEAAIEDLSVKRAIFKELSGETSPTTILATNTSSLSIAAIATAARNPSLVVGMHFFNPAPVMELVEVVRGSSTAEQTVERACAYSRAVGKTPVICMDSPGFIVNRVARAFYGEALKILGEGSASVEQIDRIMTRAGGFRMGPFELMDLIGIDVNYAVAQSVYEQFFHEPRFRPHPIQRSMVEAGLLGRKTGKGFYTYDQSKRSHGE